ncbi:MAG: hydrolase [Spirochaetae bacterium HGW-Spirochaetae-9]|nr:MAG: hydrolase [Spirochaetae bacterium HGW-Spirochaetae-9]
MINALIIDENDNVVVAIEPIAKGSPVCFKLGNKDITVIALDDITIYHKVARDDIGKGVSVLKYGERIGEAMKDIPAGSHVHVHNISNIKEDL